MTYILKIVNNVPMKLIIAKVFLWFDIMQIIVYWH